MSSRDMLEDDPRRLRARLSEAEDTLEALRRGEADALVVQGPAGPRVFTLRGAERPYRMLVERMSDGALLLSDAGVVLFANRAFAELTGMAPEVMIGRRFATLLPPEAVPRWEALCAGGEPHAELVLRHVRGEERPVRVALTSFAVEEQRLFGLVLVDLRPLRAIERDLIDQSARRSDAEAQAERLRLALAAGQLGTFDWLIDDGRVYWAPETERIWGLAPGGFEGTADAWLARVHPDDREAVAAHLRTAVERGVYAHEYRAVRRDGAIRWVSAHATLLRDGEGGARRLVGVVQDVTEQRRTEQALRENDRRKDEFLAMLAHELRNPMAPIRNATRILHLLGPVDTKVGFARDVIDRQLSHMTRLVDDLLDVSRITRGAVQLRLDTVDMHDVVEAAVEAARPEIDRRGHALEIEVAPGPMLLRGDRARLVQVLTNLLHNAAKFTPDHGHIALSAGRAGDGSVVVAVRDSGIGIPPEAQDSIFNLFSQESSSLARSAGGLGIGLTVAREMVEMHGGRIEVESAGRDLGAEFRIRLPAA